MQITLTGNKLSSTGGNQLNADLTGDGIADLVFGAPEFGSAQIRDRAVWVGIRDLFNIVGSELVSAWNSTTTYVVKAGFAPYGVGVTRSVGFSPRDISYLNPITFSDPGINGGSPTAGWLQVNAFNTSATDHTVELSRLIFDDASTTRPAFASIPGAQTEWGAVPEPSSLGLLALGAGGLLIRRSRAKAAA